jgi:hypothetical protein
LPGGSSTGREFLPPLRPAIDFRPSANSHATGGDVAGTIGESMTAISAPTPSMNQTRGSDESVEQVAEHLSMSAPARAWGPWPSFFLSICSFGLLPLLVWPRRWNAFAELERQQMISLAGWWRRRASPMQAQSLDAAISQLGPQSMFTIVPVLILVFVGVRMVSFLNDGRSLENILGLTVGYPRYRRWVWNPIEMNLHVVWIVSLLIGYACHWLGVRNHALAMESLAMKINEIAGPGRARSFVAVSSGLNPLWIGAAILLCGMHAWWGIPLVLAGAMQRKYMKSTSPRLRGALVQQLLDRPAAQSELCRTPGCGAVRRMGANFCPRCGARV